MKKVLLTINNNKLSGIETFTLLLASRIDKRKFKVIVGMPTKGPLCKIFEENKIDYFIFNNKVNGKYSLSGIIYLFKNIIKNKYDIIHAQAGVAPCLIGKLLGTKLVIEHKHGLDFTSEEIDNMNFIKLNYERLKKYLADKTLTGCNADKEILIKRFNFNYDNVEVIYNGIESNNQGKTERNNKKFTIGTIGRLTYQKGQEYFIEAARTLLSIGYDFEFHIYGEGEKLSEFSSLISKYKIENNVFLKGYTHSISETIRSFDLFVMPSRYEGIPYVILEAMNDHVPVISANVGGISEVIENNVTGILVKKENPAELADKILQLYKSDSIRVQLEINAKRNIDQKYRIENTIESVEKIYDIV